MTWHVANPVFPPELAALDDRFVLRARDVTVGGHPWRLELPRSAEDLISEADFARDERLPYWADLWPSAIVLADIVAALDGAGRRAIEFGAGLGLPSLAAARAGFEVTITDYYDDALLFARRNAVANLGYDLATVMIDWRELPSGLGQFDLVLAADVLYERPYAPLVAHAIMGTLAPGGCALVADPGRIALGAFLDDCTARGASVRERCTFQHEDGPSKHTITVHEVRRGLR